jgi:hypothetical protein
LFALAAFTSRVATCAQGKDGLFEFAICSAFRKSSMLVSLSFLPPALMKLVQISGVAL